MSVHVERLAAYAVEAGLDVTVWDMYTVDIKDVSAGAGVRVCSARRLADKWRLLFHLATGADVVHLHLSAASKCLRIFGLLRFASMFSRTLVTIHSGAFPDELLAMGQLKRAALVNGLRCCTSVICVSDRIAASAANAGVAQPEIRVVPAFIPPNHSNDPAPQNANAEPGAPSVTKVCASGYASPIYGWHTLLDAIELVGSACEYHLAFYNEFEQPYFDTLLARVSGSQNIKVHLNLSPESFAALLCSCDVFIRPTTTDGDSIAVREAIFFGKSVVASNAVQRPEGCVLFDTNSPEDLANKIVGVIAARVLKTDVSRDTLHVDRIGSADAVLAIYREASHTGSSVHAEE